MDITELLQRLYGFAPTGIVFWMAVGLALTIITVQSINKWARQLTELPWMRAENQHKREQIIQKMKKDSQ